ncbi:MAG TPA: ABC transporter ATP-binding protein [Mycobacteriales bacterium]
MALLEVNDLHVSFNSEDGVVKAVQGVSFSLEPGKTLGIVGESGSGKSVSTQTIMGLTRGARITGEALFHGENLLTLSAGRMRRIRGAKIAMIFQDPLSSLHPHYRVGRQIAEMIRTHESVSRAEAKKRARDLLAVVGIPQPDRRVDDYPHQFSGGMRQRAMIAMALALNPELLIADEPTTALDVTVQAQILDLIARLQAEFNTAVIMITHDLGVVAGLADEVMVMYAGRPVEFAPRRDIYYNPHHPYTKGLIASIPSAAAIGGKLTPIAGTPPSLINLPSGCAFHPRCPVMLEQCPHEIPALKPIGDARHRSACFQPVEYAGPVGALAAKVRAGGVQKRTGARRTSGGSDAS